MHIRSEPPIAGRATSVVVLAHGLNLAPARLDDWARMFGRHDAHVVRPTLRGHCGNLGEMRSATVDAWRDDFAAAVEHARREAERLSVPMHFVGYSLGALVGLEWMSRQPPHTTTFDRLVLLAPAVSLPRYTRPAIGLLSVLGPRVLLPSRSPRRYRANRGTSIGAYQALLALKESLERTGYVNANRPTLIVIDPGDEVVSRQEIVRLIAQHRLDHWRLESVDNRLARRRFGFRHLIVDQEATGPDLWAALEAAVVDHLRLTVSS